MIQKKVPENPKQSERIEVDSRANISMPNFNDISEATQFFGSTYSPWNSIENNEDKSREFWKLYNESYE